MPLPTRLATLLLALALTALAGCQGPKFATAEQEAAAQGWIAKLRTRDFDAIDQALDPALKGDAAAEQMRRMADAFPPGPASRTTLVGDNHVASADGHLVNLTYEMEIGGQWILANVATRTRDGVTAIVGMNVNRMPSSLEKQNRFGLADKPLACYVALALAVFAPVVSLVALVLCIRTPLRGRKWPWIIAILAGVGMLTVNWTTGQWEVHVLMLQFLGAGFFKSQFGPLMLSAGLPLAALIFLVKRVDLRKPPEPAAPAAAA